MKNVIYLCFILSSVLFACGGSGSNTNSADSTAAGATDSTVNTNSGAAASSSSSDASSGSSSAAPAAPPDGAETATTSGGDPVYTAPATEVTTNQFTTQLAPYGKWVDYPGQGQCFVPNGVGADFQPYSTNGHWVYTSEGWTWTSGYSWGWAAFHYGNWFQDKQYGWMWKPGTQWAPARVTWAQSGGYYGWAPLGINVGVTIEANARWTPPAASWTFVDKQHIDQVELNRYVAPRANNVTIVKNVTVINNVTNHTTVINNNNKTVNNKTVVYNKGPQINEVEKVTNKKVEVVNITNNHINNNKVVNNNKEVKKVEINNNKTVVRKPAPRPAQHPEPKKPAPNEKEKKDHQ